jgi:hypothetical protein
MLSEEQIVVNIVSETGIMFLFFASSQLLLLPLFFIIFLDLLAVSMKTLSQCNAHSDGADELNKHDHAHLPINTEVNCHGSSYKMEIESYLINVFPQIYSLVN